MNYALEIRDHNIKPHLDLEKEVSTRGDGLLTFTIRVNNGNIVDLNVTEYVNAQRKYGIITGVVITQYRLAHDSRERSASDTLRPDNIHSTSAGRPSASQYLEHSEE